MLFWCHWYCLDKILNKPSVDLKTDFSLISCQRRGLWCNFAIRNPFLQNKSTMPFNGIYFSEVSIHSKIKKGIVIKYILLTLNFAFGYKIWDIFFSVIILVLVESLLQERIVFLYDDPYIVFLLFSSGLWQDVDGS